jgi:hypothetical protein
VNEGRIEVRGVEVSTASAPVNVSVASARVTARKRRAAQFALFLLVSTVLHVPALVGKLFSSDEASLASMAMVIDDGGTLYHQTADRKPPVVPYVYAAMFKITGSRDLRPVRALGVVVLALTALLLAMEAERRYRDRRRGVVCGLLFLALSVSLFPADTQAATFELFMLLPLTGAVIASRARRPALAGACLAIAILCKQTAFVTLLPMLWLLIPQGRKAVVRCLLTCAGIIAATAAFFGPAQFLLWTVSGNRGYLKVVGPVLPMLLRGFGMTWAFIGFNVGIIALVLLTAFGLRQRDKIDLWLWLASGIFAVVAGFRFFGHYYLHLLPPLALLGAGSFPLAAGKFRKWITVSIALPSLMFVVAGLLTLRARPTASYPAIAQRIMRLAPHGSSLFVWGQLPELYWASGLDPGTRFIHTGFLTGNSGGRQQGLSTAADGMPGAWKMLEDDMHEHLPTFIADTTNADVRGSKYYPLRSTSIWPLIKSKYRWVANVDGVAVYELAKVASTAH